jgi:hypothetical protein
MPSSPDAPTTSATVGTADRHQEQAGGRARRVLDRPVADCLARSSYGPEEIDLVISCSITPNGPRWCCFDRPVIGRCQLRTLSTSYSGSRRQPVVA